MGVAVPIVAATAPDESDEFAKKSMRSNVEAPEEFVDVPEPWSPPVEESKSEAEKPLELDDVALQVMPRQPFVHCFETWSTQVDERA